MKVAYKSDKGMRRNNNEDCIRVDNERGIFILADGMGGHQGGEVASSTGVDYAYSFIKSRIMRRRSEKGFLKLLVEALFKAHDAIREKASTNLDLMGMGTTLVELIIKGNRAYTSHIGDSRVYYLGSGMEQITEDQTMGNYLVNNNLMLPEEVPIEKWHTLTQALGLSETIVPEMKQIELKEGDIILLCSDGLTDMLADKEIERIIQENKSDIHRAVDELIDEANNKGGKDNISVVLVEY